MTKFCPHQQQWSFLGANEAYSVWCGNQEKQLETSLLHIALICRAGGTSLKHPLSVREESFFSCTSRRLYFNL